MDGYQILIEYIEKQNKINELNQQRFDSIYELFIEIQAVLHALVAEEPENHE